MQEPAVPTASSGATEPAPGAPAPAAPATAEPASSVLVSPRVGEPRHGASPWRWPIRILLLLIVVAIVFAVLRLINTATPVVELPLNGRLALLPFHSPGKSGPAAWVEKGLSEMVAETVGATVGSAIVSPARLNQVLTPRELDLSDPAARERARQLALAVGADQVLDATLRDGREGWTFELDLWDANGRVATAEVSGESPLAAADELVFSLARGLTSSREPRRLTQSFSRSPFVDQLYATGLQMLRSEGPEAARSYFEIALDHQPGFFQARAGLTECARRRGEIETARELAVELLKESQSRGDRGLEARSLRSLALIGAIAGELESATGFYSQAFDIHVEQGDRSAQAVVLYELARLALASGERGRAEELFVERLKLQQGLADRLGEADSLFQIGSLLLASGDLEGAEQTLADAREKALQSGDVWTEMGVAATLGEVAHRRDDAAAAEEHWRRALSFYEQRNEHPRRMLISYKLAVSLVKSEQYAEAEDLLQDMRELAIELGDQPQEARAALGLAWILLRTGYPYQAKPHLDRTLELDRHIEDRFRLQQVIAWYAYEQGNYRVAVDTQLGAKRQGEKRWRQLDEEFLAVFRRAQAEGRRFPLPGESGYRSPG